MPTIDIPDRICPHCGGTKWYLRVYKKLNKLGHPYQTYICKPCDLASSKQWSQNNVERSKEIKQKSYAKLKGTEEFKVRVNENQRRYIEANKHTDHYKNLQKQQKKRAWIKHKNKIVTRNKVWIKKNPDRVKKMYQKYTKILTDSYVRAKIARDSPLNSKDIPQDLIELKRKQLLLKRKLKQHDKDQNSYKDN